MCIRVQYAPRHEIVDPWDRDRNLITIPAELADTALFTLQAVRTVLLSMGVEQDSFGARCWCGEEIALAVQVNQRENEVIHLGA
jgi:hypothetical protein